MATEEYGSALRSLPGRRRGWGQPTGREAVRRAVFDAAADLFAHQGIGNTSLRDIADAADVQVSLVGRYVGTREELIDAVFADLSDTLATEVKERPLGDLSFERDSTMGRWTVLLCYLVVTGTDAGELTERSNPVAAEAQVFEETVGADPATARLRAAQATALSLGWRLFERYLVEAAELDGYDLEDVRGAVSDTVRHLAAMPWAEPAEEPKRAER